jgi:hypothetical protein
MCASSFIAKYFRTRNIGRQSIHFLFLGQFSGRGREENGVVSF